MKNPVVRKQLQLINISTLAKGHATRTTLNLPFTERQRRTTFI
ncbi:hypothetical protein [Moorena sp. SIOASIH]|nr:hypothetical protein [Moorena sp. SIOASIH]